MRDDDEAASARQAEIGINPQHVDQSEFDFIPVGVGSRSLTSRGGAIHLNSPAGSLAFLAKCHYATVFLSPVLGVRSAVGGSKFRLFDAPAGMIGIVPEGVDGSTVWPNPRESVSVMITSSSLRDLAEQECDVGTVDLQPLNSVVIDPEAAYIAKLLKVELSERPTANELYVDSLVTLFGVHLLRNYAGIDKTATNIRGGLSSFSARQVRDYLAGHLSDKLSIAELSGICGLSPSHFIKAFTRTFGLRPHQYLTNLRLHHAQHLLGQEGMSIAEIAHLSGFSSQSHLTSTLRKHRGLTPAQLRRARRASSPREGG